MLNSFTTLFVLSQNIKKKKLLQFKIYLRKVRLYTILNFLMAECKYINLCLFKIMEPLNKHSLGGPKFFQTLFLCVILGILVFFSLVLLEINLAS